MVIAGVYKLKGNLSDSILDNIRLGKGVAHYVFQL